MLKIVFGDVENAIYHSPTYFDNTYLEEWITDPTTVAMIKDVDQSDVLGPRVIDSPFLGSILVQEISGSVETLILMRFDESEKIFNASSCGNNCAKWIVEIGKIKDLTINLHHVMDSGGYKDFSAYIINTCKHVNSFDGYIDEAFQIEER